MTLLSYLCDLKECLTAAYPRPHSTVEKIYPAYNKVLSEYSKGNIDLIFCPFSECLNAFKGKQGHLPFTSRMGIICKTVSLYDKAFSDVVLHCALFFRYADRIYSTHFSLLSVPFFLYRPHIAVQRNVQGAFFVSYQL